MLWDGVGDQADDDPDRVTPVQRVDAKPRAIGHRVAEVDVLVLKETLSLLVRHSLAREAHGDIRSQAPDRILRLDLTVNRESRRPTGLAVQVPGPGRDTVCSIHRSLK